MPNPRPQIPESARRRERINRLLGSEWPTVTMMRDKGAKSSPPWCWWMEDDGYDHDKYEVADYIPAAALPSLRASLFEEFRETVLSDEAVEAVAQRAWDSEWIGDDMAYWDEAVRLGMPGIEGARRQARKDLETALDSISNQGTQGEKCERCGGSGEVLRDALDGGLAERSKFCPDCKGTGGTHHAR